MLNASLRPIALHITISALIAVLTGCGAAHLGGFLQTDDLPYATSCRAYAAKHRKAVDELAYNPPTLLVHNWPKPVAGGKNAVMTEASFVARISKGQARRVMVVARGGVGKSTLAKALESKFCGATPTFRVDLNTDVAARIARGVKGNAIMAQVEAKLALEKRVSDRETFRELLKTGAFILLLDSLDEVPVAIRPKVVAQINAVSAKYETTAQILIFARPAVLKPDYGITGIDAKVQLPALTCGRARSTLRWTAKNDGGESRTEQFIRTYYIDRQSKVRDQCFYPYMAAYRDIQVVQRLASKFNPKGNLGGLVASLSGVHQTIIAERLGKELSALKWSTEQVLGSIDRMVRQDGRTEGSWNLEFTMDRCRKSVAADGAKTGAVKTNYICEKILQSALFSRVSGVKEWKFAHKNVADLFLARWVDREIKRTGGSCDVVDHHADWLSSKDVSGYLVGQPTGRTCLLQVTRALCKGGFSRSHVDLLYKGLPIGAARGVVVAAAKKAAADAKVAADSCEMKTLGAL
ncbi:MAG: hypothetical protein KC502_16005 [Myxococcales bacterium]|nr:hypothetical protein [Myxococcales bacterium]